MSSNGLSRPARRMNSALTSSSERSRDPAGLAGVVCRFMDAPLARLFRLDIGRADVLGPFLGIVGDELAELRGRHRQRPNAQADEARPRVRLGDDGVDRSV